MAHVQTPRQESLNHFEVKNTCYKKRTVHRQVLLYELIGLAYFYGFPLDTLGINFNKNNLSFGGSSIDVSEGCWRRNN